MDGVVYVIDASLKYVAHVSMTSLHDVTALASRHHRERDRHRETVADAHRGAHFYKKQKHCPKWLHMC